MDNHCDIYNVTLIISQKSEERGLLNEQRSNTGVFQIHPHTLPEGINGIEAVNLRRILFNHWLQQEICDPETQCSFGGRSKRNYCTTEEADLWSQSNIGACRGMGGSGVSLFCTAQGITGIVDAVDSETIWYILTDRQPPSYNHCSADRPKAQEQEGQDSKRSCGRTKPGTLLKHHIPIKTDNWDVKSPGWTEGDTVSHPGNSAEGHFGYAVNQTDILTTWVESRAILGKGEKAVVDALDEMAQAFPFWISGIDSDNGSEFINWHLLRYCGSHKIQPFRGRPYKKDDNAHIEQKNWTRVRKIMGWDRYDTQEAVDAMNDLYRNGLRLFVNLLLPSMKLLRKKRVGSRLTRV